MGEEVALLRREPKRCQLHLQPSGQRPPHKVDADSADNFTIDTKFHFIRQGESASTEEEDFILQTLIHLTQDVNGEVTAEFENFKFECQ